MNSNSICIVTVVNGNSEDLLETYESVRSQSDLEFSYIIINGASEKIDSNSFPKAHVINKLDSSLWEGMYNSLDYINADWVLYLNAGDSFHNKGVISSLKRAVKKSNSEIVYFDWKILYPNYEVDRTAPSSLENIYSGLPFCHNATLVKFTLLRRFYFCKDYRTEKHSLDYAFFLKCYESGVKFLHVSETIVRYKAQGYSDINRFGSVIGNFKYSMKSKRPIYSTFSFVRSFLTQVNIKIAKSALNNFVSLSSGVGVFFEMLLWLWCKKKHISSLPKNRYSLLVQYDEFAFSSAKMLDDVYFSSVSGIIASRRYFYPNTVGDTFFLEDLLSIRDFLICFKRALRTINKLEFLNEKVLKQIDSTILRKNAGKTLGEVRWYDFSRGRLLFVNLLCEVFSSKYGKDIESLLVNDLSYIHNYSVFSNLLNDNISVYYYSPAFSDGQIYIRRLENNLSNLVHAATVDEVFDKASIRDKFSWLSDWYRNKYGDASYVSKRLLSNNSFEFDTGGRKLVVIFSHVLYDANGAYGTDIFSSMEKWIRDTLTYYRDFGRDDVFVCLKEHPANRFKLKQDSQTPERKIFNSLGLDPNRFRIILNDDAVSTAAILASASGIITIRGTVALEGASLGVPVLCAGSSRFTNQGFTIEPTTSIDYFSSLNDFFVMSDYEKSKIKVKAINWAYHLLKLAPLDIKPWTLTHTNGDSPCYEKK